MLKLRIGTFDYRVIRTEGQLFDDEGRALLGQIDYDQRIIRIAGDCPNAAIGEIVCHEAAHAWRKHMPEPRTEEDFCDFIAAVGWGLIRDIERQGGTACLLTLSCQERVISQEAVADLNPTDRVEAAGCACGVCGQAVAPASVVREGPRRHARIGTPVIHLTFYCDYCEALVKWTELASPGGLPTGVVVDPPVQECGQAVTEFCRRHPRQSGVLMTPDD